MTVPRGKDGMSYLDAGKDLRRTTGVFLIFCGVGPLMTFSGLAVKIGNPDFPWIPVLFAAPFIVTGVVVTAIGIFTRDPKRSAQRIGAGAALIALGDLLIFGIRAAIV